MVTQEVKDMIKEYKAGGVTQSISSGDNLGTDIGKTAAGNPRDAGHDDHVMEVKK